MRTAVEEKEDIKFLPEDQRLLGHPEPKFKFRILVGHHTINVGSIKNPKLVTYRQGDEFESDKELDKMHNSKGSIKFERLEYQPEDTEELLEEEERRLAERKAKLRAGKSSQESVQDAARRGFYGEQDIGKMTVAQLTDLAEANGIDLGRAKSKDQIVEIINSHLVDA